VVVLIVLHIVIFWFIPIKGNMQLYGKPFCDASETKKYQYGCKNFE
jgi:hypothetical protein